MCIIVPSLSNAYIQQLHIKVYCLQLESTAHLPWNTGEFCNYANELHDPIPEIKPFSTSHVPGVKVVTRNNFQEKCYAKQMQSTVQTLASVLSLLTFHHPSLEQILSPPPLKTRISCCCCEASWSFRLQAMYAERALQSILVFLETWKMSTSSGKGLACTRYI